MLMGAAGNVDVAVHLDSKAAELTDAKEVNGETGVTQFLLRIFIF